MSASRSWGAPLWAHLAILCVKCVMFLYDVITLAVFIPIYKPWTAWMNRRLVYSKKPGRDPRGPYTRTQHRIKLELFDNIHTVDQLVRNAVQMYRDQPALGSRIIYGEEEEIQPDGKPHKKLTLGELKWLSFGEFDEKCTQIGRGLMALGIRPRQNVCILADTRLEWMLAAQACFRINVPVVTLYTTLADDAILHGLNETEVTHLITTEEMVPKVRKLSDKLPYLTHVIYMEQSYTKTKPTMDDRAQLIPFSQLEILGKAKDKALDGGCPSADDTAIIMYTSGSTGVPKAVMITHANIVAAAKGLQTVVHMLDNTSVYLAYLPLAHIFEISVEVSCLSFGMRIGYSSPLTLTEKSTAIKKGDKGDASLIQPDFFTSVPLVLDRIRRTVLETAEARGIFFKMFLKHAIAYKVFWLDWGFDTPLLNLIVFKKVTAFLGGKVKVCAAGSAPLSGDTHSFMRACLGCPIVQGYGLTETTAGGLVMETTDMSVGRIGAPLYGTCLKLVDWPEAGYFSTDKPYPRGEILMGGDTIAKGYYKNDQLTNETFRMQDGTRWLYTGDIGEIFPDGTVRVIDRKKDIVKLQHGEYISLGKVETELKTSPLIENVCVYASSFHTYVIALISPNEKVLSELAAELLGRTSLSLDELCANPRLVDAVTRKIIVHAKDRNLRRMEIPTKIKLCVEPWLPETGLVTGALKLRRKMIENYYRIDIDMLYNKKFV